MVTYNSRLRSINQQFNFQGSTGLIVRFGAWKGRRRERKSSRRGDEEGRGVNGRRAKTMCTDQFQSDSAREASLLCSCEGGDGSQTGGGLGAKPRGQGGNFWLLGFSPSPSRIPPLADWSCSLCVFVHGWVCVCTGGQPWLWLTGGGWTLPLMRRRAPPSENPATWCWRLFQRHSGAPYHMDTTLRTHTRTHTLLLPLCPLFFFSFSPSLPPSPPPSSVCCVPPPWALRVH